MGYKLNFNDKGEATCINSGEQYVLKQDQVHLVPHF
jgi:hypothetical protein